MTTSCVLNFTNTRLGIFFIHSHVKYSDDETCFKNKVCIKETNEQMHGRNISSGRDTNLGLADAKPLFFGQVQNFVVDPFPNKPWFLCVCSTSLLNAQWEKEKLLITSNISFFHGVFFSFEEIFAVNIKFEIIIWKLFQFGRV